jgi:ATP synthase protein I
MNTPDQKAPRDPGSSRSATKRGATASLVRAESLIQLALLLPAATLIGWAIGVALDHRFHQQWISIVGLLFGAAAGLVQMFRVVLSLNKE